jgi:hypothetical protein
MTIVLVVVAAYVVLMVGIFVVVFGLIRRRIGVTAGRLGVAELDSGTTKMVTRFDDFRSERLVRGGYRRNPVRAVLTATHLHLIEVPQRYGIFERSDLARFTVGIQDGQLWLRSTDPPDATGTIDYRIEVDDPERWVHALLAAGARPAD